jgi:hypothetical protein
MPHTTMQEVLGEGLPQRRSAGNDTIAQEQEQACACNSDGRCDRTIIFGTLIMQSRHLRHSEKQAALIRCGLMVYAHMFCAQHA